MTPDRRQSRIRKRKRESFYKELVRLIGRDLANKWMAQLMRLGRVPTFPPMESPKRARRRDP